MDQLKNAVSGNKSSSNQQSGGQNEDYADKGLDSAEKKFGGSMGQDSGKNRAMNEKVTDGARGMVEKTTGKDVPDKVSN